MRNKNKTTLITIALLAAILVLLVGYSFWSMPSAPQISGCAVETKTCPDGSVLRSMPPSCTFAPCASPQQLATSTVKINQILKEQAITITPLEVVEDSRCARGVMCIQAGTVKVRVKVEAENKSEEVVLTQGVPVVAVGKQILLRDVTPEKEVQTVIVPNDYQFNFLITGGVDIGRGVLAGQMKLINTCKKKATSTPCLVSAAMYAQKKVLVYSATDKENLIIAITPDANGKFSITLPEGNYYANVSGSTSDILYGVPREFSIEKTKTTPLDISIDAGMQ